MTATAPHRDFDAEPPEPLPPSATFVLGGRTWHVRNEDDVAWGAFRATVKVEGEDLMFQIKPFFDLALVPEDAAAFSAMLDDPPVDVTRRTVTRAMEWVFEQITGFPTTRGGGSTRTASTAKPRKAASSKARSSSRGTRRKAS